MTVLFLLAFAYGFISRGLRPGGTFVGLLVIPVTMLVAAGPIVLISYLMFNRFRETALYQNNIPSAGMVALGFAVFMLAITLARRWSRPQELLAGASLLGIGYACCLPSPDSPRLNCLAYGVDFDANQAWWLSSTRRSDPWLERYLPKGTPKEEAGPFLPHDRNRYLKAPAPSPPLGKPSLNVLEDKVQDGKRLLTCYLYSPRGAHRIWLRVVSDTAVHKAVVLGHELPGAAQHWDMTLEIPPREGVELRLETDPAAPLKISIREDAYELPKFPDFVPRPTDTAPESKPHTHPPASIKRTHLFDCHRGLGTSAVRKPVRF